MQEALKPLGLFILVEADLAKKKTETGIIIPDSAKDTSRELRGTAIEIGDAVSKLKKSDRVIFGKHAGTEITINEKPYLIIHEKDIWGVLESKISLDN